MVSQNKLPNHLLALPDELLLYITKFMKFEDLKSFMKTCYYFHNLMGGAEWIEYYKIRGYNLTQSFIEACKTLNTKLYKRLVFEERVDLSVEPSLSILLAIYGGHIKIVKFLLSDERIRPDRDALFGAIMYGHIEIVKLLLADKRVDPSNEEYDNDLIRVALIRKREEIAKLLSADKRIGQSSDDLGLAAKLGYLDILKLLLSNKEYNHRYSYAIGKASENGHLGIVKFLLDEGRDDSLCSYVISGAAENGHTEIVELLLSDERVDPSVDHNRAIKKATEKGRTKIVEILLSDKRVNTSIENCKIKQLAEQSCLKIVKLLTEHIDPSDKDNCVSRLAAQYGRKGSYENARIPNPEMIKLLLADDNFAVRLVVYFDHLDIMTLWNDRHDSPLILREYAMRWADENGHSDIIKLLCNKQVNTNLPIQLADHFGYSGIIKLLDDRQINSVTSKDGNVIGE